MTLYLDTSAAAKLVVLEAETDALSSYLDDAVHQGDPLVSSMLLETELRRVAVREDIPQSLVSAVLDRVDLLEPDRALFHEAGILPGRGMRSLDALHLATAVRVGADVVTFDERMATSARELGLAVIAPA